MSVWSRLDRLIAANGAAALVTLVRVRGSSPREAGARMILSKDGATGGTIGGGALEWQAQALAGQLMSKPGGTGTLRPFALGPALGQCCGGHVEMLVEAFAPEDRCWITPLAEAETAGPFGSEGRADMRGIFIRRLDGNACGAAGNAALSGGVLSERHGEQRAPLLLFGAGHVGRALVLALAPLPFAIRWVETRAEAFPAYRPPHVTAIATLEPSAEIHAAAAGTLVAIMTHSHALDLDLAAAALARPDIPYVGVIGSETKHGRFTARLRGLGHGPEALERFACPIGGRGLASKTPPVIAACMAVALLEAREKTAATAVLQPLTRRA